MAKAKNVRAAQVHRFGDSVAVWVGQGACTYITPKDARALARALIGAAKDVVAHAKMSASQFRSVSFDFAPTDESWRN